MTLETRTNDTVEGVVAIYDPNGPAAMIAALTWAALAGVLWWRYYATPNAPPRPKYTRPLPLGATFMLIGFLCRFSRRNHINAWSWLFETLCILLSPCLFLAENYVLLPRLAATPAFDAQFHRDGMVLSPRVVVVLYVIGDIVTVTAQLAGTALSLTFGKLVPIGQKTTTAGLWVQFAFFASFLAVFVIFGMRTRCLSDTVSFSFPQDKFATPRALYFAVAVSCALLLVRSIYRVAEYTAGASSSLGQSEVAFYLLDFVPNLLAAGVFVVVWPPNALDSTGRGAGVASTGEAGEHLKLEEVHVTPLPPRARYRS